MQISDYFAPDISFTYDWRKKLFINILLLGSMGIVLASIILYFQFLKNVDFFLVNALNAIAGNIMLHIRELTLLGTFYSGFFGGLFFIFMPVELVFITFLLKHNPFIVLGFYMAGLTLSYTFNYYIGMNLAAATKRIITPAKFYKTKNLINKYGGKAIFVFYLLPLPSQPLTAVLGVFKYNKARFYALFFLGGLLKYLVIIGIITFFI